MSGTEQQPAEPSGPRSATVETTHDEAAIVAAALRPDNTDSMRTTVSDGRVTTRIERETTGGLQATVDDYVVNLSVAEAVVDSATAFASPVDNTSAEANPADKANAEADPDDTAPGTDDETHDTTYL